MIFTNSCEIVSFTGIREAKNTKLLHFYTINNKLLIP